MDAILKGDARDAEESRIRSLVHGQAAQIRSLYTVADEYVSRNEYPIVNLESIFNFMKK